jgi:hypothetical protein
MPPYSYAHTNAALQLRTYKCRPTVTHIQMPPYSYAHTSAAPLQYLPTTPSAACSKQSSSLDFTLLTSHSLTLSRSYAYQKDERALLIVSLLSVLSLSPIHPEIHLTIHTVFHTKICEHRRPGFDPRSVHVRFAVNRAAVWRESPRVPPFALISIIPPPLRMHYLTCHRHCVTLTIRTASLNKRTNDA